MDDADLIDAAREAQTAAYAPYSEYVVGAALSTADGAVFTGCNVEVANYSNSMHAEEVALGTAVREGNREFEAIAVSSGERDGQTPCGMCRQTLSEFCGPEFRVLVDFGEEGIREYALGELLPDAITASHLDVE
jgi:cytidine deaminase